MKRATATHLAIVGTVLGREASNGGVVADVDPGDQCDLTWFWLPNRKKRPPFIRNGGRGYISGLFFLQFSLVNRHSISSVARLFFKVYLTVAVSDQGV